MSYQHPSSSWLRLLVTAAVSLAAWPALPAVATGGEPTPAVWRHDVQDAWEATKASGRPLLLFVTSESCHYCVRMKSETYTDTAVQADLLESFVPVVVDAPRQPDLVRRLGVTAYPTTVVVGRDGRVVESIRGYVGPDELRRRLAPLRTADRLSGR